MISNWRNSFSIFPCLYLRKCKENSMENMHTDVREQATLRLLSLRVIWLFPQGPAGLKGVEGPIGPPGAQVKRWVLVRVSFFFSYYIHQQCNEIVHIFSGASRNARTTRTTWTPGSYSEFRKHIFKHFQCVLHYYSSYRLFSFLNL